MEHLRPRLAVHHRAQPGASVDRLSSRRCSSSSSTFARRPSNEEKDEPRRGYLAGSDRLTSLVVAARGSVLAARVTSSSLISRLATLAAIWYKLEDR